MNSKRPIVVAAYSGLAALIYLLCYFVILKVADSGASYWEVLRDIDSTPRLVLNGILGQFFHFKYLGNLNWFAFPMLFYAVWRFRSLEPWQNGLLTVYLLGSLVIAVQGYYNYRYQLSFYPATASVVAVVIYDGIHRWASAGKILRYCWMALGAAILLTAANYGVIIFQDIQEKNAQHASSASAEQSADATPYEQRTLVDRVLSKLTLNPQKSSLEIYDEIDQLNIQSKVLVNNIPAFYYYTKQVGIFYWSGQDILYANEGQISLFVDRSDEQVLQYLKAELNCDYVFHSTLFNGFSERFADFLAVHARPVATENDLVLYQLNP